MWKNRCQWVHIGLYGFFLHIYSIFFLLNNDKNLFPGVFQDKNTSFTVSQPFLATIFPGKLLHPHKRGKPRVRGGYFVALRCWCARYSTSFSKSWGPVAEKIWHGVKWLTSANNCIYKWNCKCALFCQMLTVAGKSTASSCKLMAIDSNLFSRYLAIRSASEVRMNMLTWQVDRYKWQKPSKTVFGDNFELFVCGNCGNCHHISLTSTW